jgi:uncharacterized membrane protein YbhN (UPF0104 family)
MTADRRPLTADRRPLTADRRPPTADRRPPTAKRKFKWFTIFRFVGIVLFIVVIAQTDMRELWSWLKKVDGSLILVAILLQLVMLFIKSFRWFMLNEINFETKAIYQRFGEFLEAYALGAVTPGRMGELMKAGHAKGRAGVISTGLLVVAERGLDLSLFFLMAGLALVLGYLSVLSPFIGYVLLAVAITGIIMAFSILIFPSIVRIVGWLMMKLRIISREQPLIFVPRKPMTLLAFSVFSILSNLTAFLSFYFIALAVMLNLGFMTVSGSVALAGVINTIPITIMGIGTRDVTLIYVLNDLPKAQVIAFSSLILLVFQVFAGLLALVGGEMFLWLAKSKV